MMGLKLFENENSIQALRAIRSGQSIQTLLIADLPPDDQTLIETEYAIRTDRFDRVEQVIATDASDWVRSFARCHRDLFIKPNAALSTLNEIESAAPVCSDFQLRLRFWRLNLNFVLGNGQSSLEDIARLKALIPVECLWKGEMLTIVALAYYLAGETRKSILAFKECQAYLDETPDHFVEVFNAAMACRAALKLFDANSFEKFSERIEKRLGEKNRSKYRIRHLAYRGLIFDQLGEHDRAKVYWTKGEEIIADTQATLERAQFHLLRGVSHAIQNQVSLAAQSFGLAHYDLKLAQLPQQYLAEVHIAESLVGLSNVQNRAVSLRLTVANAESAQARLESHLASLDGSNPAVAIMYKEAIRMCQDWLEGCARNINPDGHTSLVVSILDNVTHASKFARELSHFRLLPNFVHKVSESDLSLESLKCSIHETLRVRPTLNSDRFILPGELCALQSEPEIKAVLDFASVLYQLGQKASYYFQKQSRMQSMEKAAILLHDLQYFSELLSVKARNPVDGSDLTKLSSELSGMIKDCLRSIRDGSTGGQKDIVHLGLMLDGISKTLSGMTGKKIEVNGDFAQSFLWINEALLNRVLFNLAKNGLDAGHGAAPVTITGKMEKFLGDEFFTLYIADNGQGLDQASLESVLNREIELSSGKSDGFGLGLKSAFSCAQSLELKIELVQKVAVQGTCFKIRIPFVRGLGADGASSMHGALHTSLRLLVIDDNEFVLNEWREFASREAVALMAVTPVNAVGVLNDDVSRFDWIILDYHLKLPKMNGARLGSVLLGSGLNDRSGGVISSGNRTKLALSTAFSGDELPQDARTVSWSAVIGKSPCIPTLGQGLDQICMPLSEDVGLRTDLTNLRTQLSYLRHEIKNELGPLKVAYEKLKKRYPGDSLVGMASDAVHGLEKLVRKKRGSK